MKATSTLWPSASSPRSVLGPVGRTWPFSTAVLADEKLLVDRGVLVRAAELGQLVDVGAELALAPPSTRTMNALAVDLVDDPGRRHITTAPESLGDHRLMPVPTIGPPAARGHGWRCMFEPISGAVGVVVLQEGDQRGRHRHLIRKAGRWALSICQGKGGPERGMTRLSFAGCLKQSQRLGSGRASQVRSSNWEAYSWHVLSGVAGRNCSSRSPYGRSWPFTCLPIGAKPKSP